MISGGKLCILNEIRTRSQYNKSNFLSRVQDLARMTSADEYEKLKLMKGGKLPIQDTPLILYRFDESGEINVFYNPDYSVSRLMKDRILSSNEEAEYSADAEIEFTEEAKKESQKLKSITKDELDFANWLKRIKGDSFGISIGMGTPDMVGFKSDNSKLNWIPVDYSTYWDEIELNLDKEFDKSVTGKLKAYLYKSWKSFFSKMKPTDEKIDALEFFDKVKEAFEILEAPESVTKELMEYVENLKRLKKSDRIITRAITKILSSISENKLSNHQYRYISESQAVEFIRNSKRGLAFTYLSDYDKPIPEEVTKKFEEAEKLYAFDNYVILHYVGSKEDRNKVKKNAEEEERRRKDPILFGLITGSRKLYYITDWITEDDDLTLEKLLGEISGEAELV